MFCLVSTYRNIALEGGAYGGKTMDPTRMAALPPATVIVKGLRRTLSLFGMREDIKAEGMNNVPTAEMSAGVQFRTTYLRHLLTFNEL